MTSSAPSANTRARNCWDRITAFSTPAITVIVRSARDPQSHEERALKAGGVIFSEARAQRRTNERNPGEPAAGPGASPHVTLAVVESA